MSAIADPTVASDPHVFLIGRPPIGELLGFFRTMCVDGQSIDLASVTAEWRIANDHVLKLENDEAGLADNPPVIALAESLAPSLRPLCQIVFVGGLISSYQRMWP